MENDGYRQQKAAQQEEPTYLDFSEAEAAAAREAAARAAAGQTSAAQPSQGGAPEREQAMAKIQAIQQQVDALEKEVRHFMVHLHHIIYGTGHSCSIARINVQFQR